MFQLLHTAAWDERFDEEAWKNKTVAVIGSGASAVQVVPRMQVGLYSLRLPLKHC
jgi:cation diffusion facilitator CzcD-associated flavoprotein CzcO